MVAPEKCLQDWLSWKDISLDQHAVSEWRQCVRMQTADLAGDEFWGWTPYHEAHGCSKNIWLIHNFMKLVQYFCFVCVFWSLFLSCLVQLQHDVLSEQQRCEIPENLLWESISHLSELDAEQPWQIPNYFPVLFVARFSVMKCAWFHPQGDMGEDGPKGDMGEKVSEQADRFFFLSSFVLKERNSHWCYNHICRIYSGWMAQPLIQVTARQQCESTFTKTSTWECSWDLSLFFFPLKKLFQKAFFPLVVAIVENIQWLQQHLKSSK